jgi:hypothetical protein
MVINVPKRQAQSARTTLNEAVITSSNLPSPLLCGHVKKNDNK